jgi:hypothetical protein
MHLLYKERIGKPKDNEYPARIFQRIPKAFFVWTHICSIADKVHKQKWVAL